MKGLLIKDFKLIKNQRSFVIIAVAICMWLLYSGREPSFALSYLAAMFSIMVVSTISYDEHDNGMNFLLTFPVSRRVYVVEKYVFGLLLSAAVLAAGSVITLAVSAAKSAVFGPQEWLEVLLVILLTVVLILAVTLPVQLKFGAEQSRVVLLIGIVCVGIAGYGMSQAAQAVSLDLSGIVLWFDQADAALTTVCFVLLSGGLLGISCMISMAIMNRKQF